ncbi:GNAT family N-acetyltransferase [Luteipulveratus flavus]|uniref:GNAT family N-acetyltransferase n=1 Tax=Luteipulveratus flavus TaxID=3031728 RepID=A0ABT6CAP3_9MICO|nr:GNAT family N-acetyltransferase [Luteipulveratus sp. YIM 133296]MDF8265870.1 GNAT family N-acetyltransferase [Luteipulveratus sp. YIM 133296]
MDDLTIQPLTQERWKDLVALFGTRGGASWCWCQYFVQTGRDFSMDRDANQRALRAQMVSAQRPLGLLAYGGGVPIGWVALGPLGSYQRLTASRSLDDVRGSRPVEDVWRTSCFVVKVGRRRRGVSTALLRSAIGFAREHGARSLEGHPVDVDARTGRVGGDELYHGTMSMFVAEGFREIGRTSPTRPVMELVL